MPSLRSICSFIVLAIVSTGLQSVSVAFTIRTTTTSRNSGPTRQTRATYCSDSDDGNSITDHQRSDDGNGNKIRPMYHHHTAIRTRNIENAINFYSLFGYQVETKFRAGPARAAWLVNHDATFDSIHDKNGNGSDDKSSERRNLKGQSDVCSRLEIIEVPNYILQEKEGTIKRALDLLENVGLLGINHYALDVTPYISSLQKEEYYGLDQFLNDVNETSMEKFGKTLRVAVKPHQKVIGNQVFELCFLYDADGCIVELLRYIKELQQDVQSGWEPWDGTGFVGQKDVRDDDQLPEL